MKLISDVVRSIKYGTFGALVPALLLCGTAWAETWSPPGVAPTNQDTITYDPRGNFDVDMVNGRTTHIDQPFSLILANGFGDMYFLNMLRDRDNYQAYKGYGNYRSFSLSGMATGGEVVLMRIKATPGMPEHFSLLSTSIRWRTDTYILNDVFRWLNSTVMVGYENWWPYDLSCSMAMYVVQGGFK
jgi:hypothetical protein